MLGQMNPTMATTAQVVTGSAFGQQLSVLILWWLQASYKVVPTNEQALSLAMVVGAVCGFLSPILTAMAFGLMRKLAVPFNGSQGFTLIELLVVTGIMAVLVAIAVPQFMRYRKTAFDAVAQADLRSAAAAQEAYANLHGKYADTAQALIDQGGLRLSEGVDLSIEQDPSGYTLTAKLPDKCAPGSGEWRYSSDAGRVTGVSCR